MVPQETFWSIVTEQMAQIEKELKSANVDSALKKLQKMQETVTGYKRRGCIVTDGEDR